VASRLVHNQGGDDGRYNEAGDKKVLLLLYGADWGACDRVCLVEGRLGSDRFDGPRRCHYSQGLERQMLLFLGVQAQD